MGAGVSSHFTLHLLILCPRRKEPFPSLEGVSFQTPLNAFQQAPTSVARPVLCPDAGNGSFQFKKWLPVSFQFLRCSFLQPDGLSGRVSANTVCFTAVRWHWHWIEKALKIAINHLMYVGSDLYWYGSGYYLKWLSFILPFLWGLLQCTPLTTDVVIIDNWL